MLLRVLIVGGVYFSSLFGSNGSFASAENDPYTCYVYDMNNNLVGAADEEGDLFTYFQGSSGRFLAFTGTLKRGTFDVDMCIYYSGQSTCNLYNVGSITDYGNLYARRWMLLNRYNSTNQSNRGIVARLKLETKTAVAVAVDGTETPFGKIEGNGCDLNHPASYRRALAAAYRSLMLDGDKVISSVTQTTSIPHGPGGGARFPRP